MMTNLDPELNLLLSRQHGAELQAQAQRDQLARRLVRAGPRRPGWWRRLTGHRATSPPTGPPASSPTGPRPGPPASSPTGPLAGKPVENCRTRVAYSDS